MPQDRRGHVSTTADMLTMLRADFAEERPYVRVAQSTVRLVCRFVAYDHPNGGLTAAVSEAGLAHALDRLNVYMGSYRVHLTTQHEDVGIAWLWQWRDRLKLGQHERLVLRNIEGVMFSGVALQHRGSKPLTAPIYTVAGPKGAFSYEAWSWQSGVTPRLV